MIIRARTIPGTMFAGVLAVAAAVGAARAQDDPVEDVIEVVGDRRADDPGAVFRVGPDVVLRPGADHPAQVLNGVPGVNVQMNSGQEHLISLRSPVLTGGAGQGSFLILVDGVPTRAPAFGNVNALFELPYESAQGIEVIRGPGSAQYGSNALHGVINVIQARREIAPRVRAQVTGSTLSRYRADVLLSGGGDNGGWLVSASAQDDLGWRDQSGLEQQKLSVRLTTRDGAWDLTSDVFGTSLNQETAGFVIGDEAYKDEELVGANPNPEAYRDAEYLRASVRAVRPFGGGTLALTPFAIYQRMEFRQHFLPYKGIETNGQDSVGLRARYDRETSEWEWTVGTDLQWAEGFIREVQPEPFGFFPGDDRFPVGTHYDFAVKTLTTAGYLQLRHQLTENWRVLAGLRGEHHSYEYDTDIPSGVFGRFRVAPDRSDDFGIFTPKAGVVWSGLPSAEVFANYARGERAPQASDLYRLQSQQGVGEARVETLDSLEIGMRGELPGSDIRYDLAAFAMEKENFFFRDADGLNVTDGKTDHWGIEAVVRRENDRGFVWQAGVSYAVHRYAFDRPVSSESEAISVGDDVDTAPRWLVDASVGYVSGSGGLYLDVQHVGEYFTNAANSRRYPGHTVAGLRMVYDVADGLTGYVTVGNLFDENYADRADFAFGDERYFPGEPRHVIAGLRIEK